MKIFSGCLYLMAVGMLLNAGAGEWAFDFSDRGAGWILLDVVVSLAFGLAAFGLWRRASRGQTPLWRRIVQSWQDDHAVHVFITTGRLLGLAGGVLLAVAVTTTHRWSQLPQNWGRALPFGVLAVVFLSAGTRPVVRRWVLPCLGVIASVLITLPFGAAAGGAWEMFGAAIFLLLFGGGMLALALAAFDEGKEHRVSAKAYPLTLLGVGVGLGALCLLVLRSDAFGLVGWWGVGVLASGLLATAWETLVVTRFVTWAGVRLVRARPAAVTPDAALASSEEPEEAS